MSGFSLQVPFEFTGVMGGSLTCWTGQGTAQPSSQGAVSAIPIQSRAASRGSAAAALALHALRTLKPLTGYWSSQSFCVCGLHLSIFIVLEVLEVRTEKLKKKTNNLFILK